MPYEELGGIVFMVLLLAPALIVGLLLPLVDIRYGNTYLLGAFFDRTLYRDEHPFWFWLVEAIQIVMAVLMFSAVLFDLSGRLSKLL
jgi:hypothetical protein